MNLSPKLKRQLPYLFLIVGALLLMGAAANNRFPLRFGHMETDLDAGAHSITNITSLLDVNGNPFAGGGSAQTNIAVAGVTNAGTAAYSNATAFALATHTHAAADVTSGVFAIGRLATGTPDGTKFVRDDGTLAVPPGVGTVTSVAASGPAGFTWSAAVTGSGTLTATTPGIVVTNGESQSITHSNTLTIAGGQGLNVGAGVVPGNALLLDGTFSLDNGQLTGGASSINIVSNGVTTADTFLTDGSVYLGGGITSAKFFMDSTGAATFTNTLKVLGTSTFSNNVTVDAAHTFTATTPTLVTPTIASFVNATHNHANAAGGGTLTAPAIAGLSPTFNVLTSTGGVYASSLNVTGAGPTIIYGDANNTNALVVAANGLTVSNALGTLRIQSGNVTNSGAITSTNGFSANATVFTKPPTNTPTDAQVIIATGTAGDTKWGAAGSSSRTVNAQTSTTDQITAAGAFATTYTLAANQTAGTSIHIRAYGKCTTTGTASPISSFSVKFGSTTIASNPGTLTTQMDTSDTAFYWMVDCNVVVVTTGASGTVQGNGFYSRQDTSNNSGKFFGILSATPVTIDTTATQSISINENSTLVSGQTFNLQQLVVEIN